MYALCKITAVQSCNSGSGRFTLYSPGNNNLIKDKQVWGNFQTKKATMFCQTKKSHYVLSN